MGWTPNQPPNQSKKKEMRRTVKLIGGGTIFSGICIGTYANVAFAPSTETKNRRIRRFAGVRNNTSSPIEGISRFLRATYTCLVCAYEYDALFRKLEKGEYESKTSEAYLRDLERLHYICANRTLELCRNLGGIYVKVGQYVATLSPIVPEPYVLNDLYFSLHEHTHTRARTHQSDGQKH